MGNDVLTAGKYIHALGICKRIRVLMEEEKSREAEAKRLYAELADICSTFTADGTAKLMSVAFPAEFQEALDKAFAARRGKA